MVFVYMPNRGEALLFGGTRPDGQPLGDTWTWKAGCWIQQQPALSPGARDSATAAFDPVHGNVVLYGGSGLGLINSDTWIWDGRTWTAVVTSGPQLPPGTPAGFDAKSNRVLMFGGAYDVATFTWDGAQWTKLAPAASPSARISPCTALDPVSGQLLLFGGRQRNRGLVNETWTWNGKTWVQLRPLHNPPARYDANCASWSAGSAAILWGGLGGGGADFLTDAWAWTGTDWTQLPSPGFSRIRGTGIDVGPRVVFFGGEDKSGSHNDVIVWDGTAWERT